MSAKDIVGLVFTVVIGIATLFYVFMVLRTQFKGKWFGKTRFVTERELPEILKDAITSYLEAERGGGSFTFNWAIHSDGSSISVARCPSCFQKNRLDKRGIEGAKCAACGLPLERTPKAKLPEKVAN